MLGGPWQQKTQMKLMFKRGDRDIGNGCELSFDHKSYFFIKIIVEISYEMVFSTKNCIIAQKIARKYNFGSEISVFGLIF